MSTDHYAASLSLPRPTPAFARAAELKNEELEHDRMVQYVRVNDAVQYNVPVEVGIALICFYLDTFLDKHLTSSLIPFHTLSHLISYTLSNTLTPLSYTL